MAVDRELTLVQAPDQCALGSRRRGGQPGDAQRGIGVVGDRRKRLTGHVERRCVRGGRIVRAEPQRQPGQVRCEDRHLRRVRLEAGPAAGELEDATLASRPEWHGQALRVAVQMAADELGRLFERVRPHPLELRGVRARGRPDRASDELAVAFGQPDRRELGARALRRRGGEIAEDRVERCACCGERPARESAASASGTPARVSVLTPTDRTVARPRARS